MTETKTLAQRRLLKLREAIKDGKKLKLANAAPPLKSYRQSRDDLNKKAAPKRDSNSKKIISQDKDNEKNSYSSILTSLNKNDLSTSVNSGMECQQHTFTQERLKSRTQQRLQNLSSKSNSLEKSIQQSQINPSPVNQKEVVLKRLKSVKQFNYNKRTEKNLETFQQVAEKRCYDHENLEKKKITKNKKSEDSSKNEVTKKKIIEQNLLSDGNTFASKMCFIMNSYAARDNDCHSPEKVTTNKSNDCDQIKEPFDRNRKNITFSINRKKDPYLGVKDKERGIKDKEKIKKVSASSPSKTKLQARLQKVKTDMKEKQKGIKKEVDVLPKDDNYHFIESMDWEPSNDLILRSIREEVDPSKEIMEWQYICGTDYNIGQDIGDNSLYLVVDTNVLIRNLELIKKLSKAMIRGFKVVQVIPWQVLKELDKLKAKVDYKNVNTSARKAINFLSEVTNSDQFNLAFQSQSKHFEDCSAFVVEVPDDHLIKCCYQFTEMNHKVLLLSNDVNLRVKANTNNIQAVDDKWIIKLLDQESKPSKQSIHCFEKNPEEHQRGCDGNDSCHFAHKTTLVILSYLYNIVLLKFKEKHGDLWPFWVLTEPHFPELLNFMTSSSYFKTYWIQLNLIKGFYIKSNSYDSVKPPEIEKLGRNCIRLVKSMCTDEFISSDLALQFFKDLSFLKCFPILDWSDINYIEGSYRLAQKYLKDTEDSLNEFVAYIRTLYAEKGPLLYRNKEVLRHIDINLNLVKEFGNAFSQFQLIQEQIPEDCEVAIALHKTICDFLGEKLDFSKFPIFSPEDIVEYVNPNRHILMPALSWLMNQESFLTEIKSKLI